MRRFVGILLCCFLTFSHYYLLLNYLSLELITESDKEMQLKERNESFITLITQKNHVYYLFIYLLI